jgi:Concanavalin A-like lectin/glucanases superfamily
MDQDLIDLLAAWKGDEPGAERLDQLVARLREDEAFQQAFVDEIWMLGMLKVVQSMEPRWLKLQDELGWSSSAPPGQTREEEAFLQRVEDGLPRRRAPRRAWWALAATAALVAAVVLVARGRPRPGPAAEPAETPVAASRPGGPGSAGIALLVRLDAATWRPSGRPGPVEGTLLSAGRLRLESGRATLSFFSGVTLTLEGPADIDLVASDWIFCRQGKLRTTVPPGAKGFVVASKGTAVVDLGTDFALNVTAEGKSQLMVFEGMAEAALLDVEGTPKRTQLVEGSQSFDIDPAAGRITASSTRADVFVSIPAPATSSLVLDPAYPAAVLDSRPRSYWRFESLTRGAVANEVRGGPPLRIHGPVSLAGQSQGNGYALFRPGAPEQFLDMGPLWDLARQPGHAVEFWFSQESFKSASVVALFPPLDRVGPDPHARYAHLVLVEVTSLVRGSLYPPASVRFLHRWPIDMRVGDNLCSEGVYVPGRWHHVVAQKVGDWMELYFDGEPGRSLRLVPDHPSVPCQLVVGRRTPASDDPKDSRSFVGRFDELALYDHPLSPEEVRRHHALANLKVRP